MQLLMGKGVKLVMSNKEIRKHYSVGEEITNAVTHGIGAGLSIAGLVLLVIRAAFYAPAGHKAAYITGFALFGASLVVLYVFSTLYHALPLSTKKVFGIFDHISIYILIAGTYTGFCLSVLHGTLGWVIFGIIWGIAVIGIVFYSIFGNKAKIASVITYIIMGWLIMFAVKPLKQALPPRSLLFLVSGGAVYTLGCVFYAMKKYKWTHSIWHLFVLGGSILHFFALFFSV